MRHVDKSNPLPHPIQVQQCRHWHPGAWVRLTSVEYKNLVCCRRTGSAMLTKKVLQASANKQDRNPHLHMYATKQFKQSQQ